MDKHILSNVGVLNAQVCSEGTLHDALEWLCDNHPAGTTNNWQIDERECVKPVQCRDHENRKHFVFMC